MIDLDRVQNAIDKFNLFEFYPKLNKKGTFGNYSNITKPLNIHIIW